MTRTKNVLKHILSILIVALGYHAVNQALFGSTFMSKAVGELGWGWYALINIGAGSFLYCMGWAIRKQVGDWREMKRQRAACRFPVKIFTMSDPAGMATMRLRCGKDRCIGFLARAVDQAHREGTFCLMCNRSVDEAKEFDQFGHMEARLGFM